MTTSVPERLSPLTYDIASESTDSVVIDMSSDWSEAKRHDIRIALRICQVIGPIIAILGTITCGIAYVNKSTGYTVLGLITSCAGCVISWTAAGTFRYLREKHRI